MKYWIVALLTIIASSAFAQTEISGEVSGIWTSDDSPYIVVDSTWVPEGDTLILSEGTRVEFLEGQGLYVWGRLICNGTDERDNNVRIYAGEDAEHWRGLRFYGRNVIEFNYTYMEDPDRRAVPDTAIFLDAGCQFTMNNSYIEVDNSPIRSVTPDTRVLIDCDLVFIDSEIDAGNYISMVAGSVVGERSEFSFGPSGYGFNNDNGQSGWCRFTNCILGGGVRDFAVSTYEYCRFIKPFDATSLVVHVGGPGGYMIGCYVDGRVSQTRSSEPFRNNIILDHLSVGSIDRVEIFDCDVRGGTGVTNINEVVIRNSTFSSDFLSHEVRSLTIDSCAFIYANMYDDAGFTFHFNRGEGDPQLTVTRSVLHTEFYIPTPRSYTATFDHNVFILDTTQRVLGAFGQLLEYSFSNNIFIATEPREALMFFTDIEQAPTFEYNCVWGFEKVFQLFENDTITEIEIDPTNIKLNPLFEWFGMMPLLSHNSPCIDSGDPDSPLDPDSTRADIGVHYFHHEPRTVSSNEVPQIIDLVSVYPNPFNNKFNIQFSIPETSPVGITVFDVSGRSVYIFPYQTYTRGVHTIPIESDLPSGNYWVEVGIGNEEVVRPVVMMK